MLSVWAHANYAYFMGGMAPSLITLWMQRIGMLWLAWELTKSNAWVGLIVAVDYAPMVVLAPFVGAFVDRVDPIRVQKLAQMAHLVLSAIMATLTFAGHMNIWLLLFLALILGCLQPFTAISRHAIVPNTVPREVIPTALATDAALYNAARFIGPALAGLVIELSSVGYTFLANSVGCAVYLLGLYKMQLAFPDRLGRGRANMLGDIAEGLSFVRGHVGIGQLFLLMAVGAIWIRPLQDLLPGFADQVFGSGPAGLGLLTAGMGVGATIAAGFMAAYARTTGLTLAVLLAFLANMIATLLFVATSNLWLAVLFGALWGGTLTMMSTGTQALVQSSVDNSIRARVMSLYTMIYRGAPFIGAMIIGWAADRIGLQLAFAIAALLCVISWLNAFARRHAITLALEGRGNDLDQRLFAASKAWAGLGYERLADLRAGLKPIAAGTLYRVRALRRRVRTLDIANRVLCLGRKRKRTPDDVA